MLTDSAAPEAVAKIDEPGVNEEEEARAAGGACLFIYSPTCSMSAHICVSIIPWQSH